MVGYVMVIYDYALAEYNIWHMMIDIASKPFGQSNKVALTCNKDNSIALHLYYEFGFRETGNEDEDEIELALLL